MGGLLGGRRSAAAPASIAYFFGRDYQQDCVKRFVVPSDRSCLTVRAREEVLLQCGPRHVCTLDYVTQCASLLDWLHRPASPRSDMTLNSAVNIG